jgi:predicted amidohydrolase YtcJ
MQAKPSGSADLLLLNGRIWTGVQPGAPAAREVEALAVQDGRVLATGYGHELEALAGPRTVVVDLEGAAPSRAWSTPTSTPSARG